MLKSVLINSKPRERRNLIRILYYTLGDYFSLYKIFLNLYINKFRLAPINYSI
jgi:hypothetical protein